MILTPTTPGCAMGMSLREEAKSVECSMVHASQYVSIWGILAAKAREIVRDNMSHYIVRIIIISDSKN